MTITFGWWIIPTLIIIVSVVYFVMVSPDGYDIARPLITICGICLAIGMVIGKIFL